MWLCWNIKFVNSQVPIVGIQRWISNIEIYSAEKFPRSFTVTQKSTFCHATVQINVQIKASSILRYQSEKDDLRVSWDYCYQERKILERILSNVSCAYLGHGMEDTMESLEKWFLNNIGLNLCVVGLSKILIHFFNSTNS